MRERFIKLLSKKSFINGETTVNTIFDMPPKLEKCSLEISNIVVYHNFGYLLYAAPLARGDLNYFINLHGKVARLVAV